MPMFLSSTAQRLITELLDLPALVSALQITADLKRDFGASGSALTAVGSMAAGSATLTLTSPADFQDGQWVYVPGAGALLATGTLPAGSAYSSQGPGGSDTFGYQLAVLDAGMGCSAACPEFFITNAPLNPGGLGADGSGEDQGGYNLIGINGNGNGTVLNASVIDAYAVWRTTVPSGSTLSPGFIGIYAMPTNAQYGFVEYGQAVRTPPPNLPATPPATALGDSLVAQVLAGGGTTTLTLSLPALTSVELVTVYHDDTVALQAACDAGGVITVPPGSYGLSQPVQVNQPLHLRGDSAYLSTLVSQGNVYATLQLNVGAVTIDNLGFNGQFTMQQFIYGTSDSVPLSNLAITNCYFQNSLSSCILLSGPSTNDSLDNGPWYTNLRVEGNTALNTKYMVLTFGNFEQLIIKTNIGDFTDYNYTGRGVSLHNSGSGYARHYTVANNIFRCGNHSAGIVCQGSGLGTIHGNIWMPAGGIYGMWLLGDSGYVERTGGSSVVSNICKALWHDTGVGIQVNNWSAATVEANIFYQFGGAVQVESYTDAAGDTLANHLVIAHNQVYYGFQGMGAFGIVYNSATASAKYVANGGGNPFGNIVATNTYRALSLGSTYTNVNNSCPLLVSQQAWVTSATSTGTLTVGSGTSGALVTTSYTLPASSSSSAPQTLTWVVLPGDSFELTGSNVTLSPNWASTVGTAVPGGVYQNTLLVDAYLYLSCYATQAAQAGLVTAWLGTSQTNVQQVSTCYVDGTTSPTAPAVLTLRVPQGYWWGFTTSQATLGELTVWGE